MSEPAHRNVPLCRPALGDAERSAVLEVLDSGWLAHGPKNAEFEEQFRELTGARHAISNVIGRGLDVLAEFELNGDL